MRFVHSAISIFFILFIFIGNAGLRVFKHACEKDGIFTSYIIPLDDHCGDHERKVPTCCQKEKVDKKDCCSDEVRIYPVNFDFFQDQDLSLPSFFIPSEEIQFAWNELAFSLPENDHFVLRPPPDGKTGKQLLIFNQVFRI